MKKHIGPLLFLALIVAVIAIGNFTPGTWLTGWDNLHPEFDFAFNIKRSIFAVWQEYQGPGLLGGMGHAADLPRQIMLWTASLLLPVQLLRWVWTFLMLLAGPLGVYTLIHSIHQYRRTALAGGIFYLFNLATVQVFIAPFDAFVTHYGVLPWLLWSNWKFLHDPSRKTLFLVAMINIIGMTHAYIPTLFLVYLILLSVLCVAALIRSFRRATLVRIIALGLTTFCINAFWLLPFTYFTLTKSSITVGAKINVMSTEETYLHNKAFGDIGNVTTLKSYWYDTADYNPTSGILEPVLGFWRKLDRNNWIVWIRYTLAALIFFGGLTTISQKNTRVWGILGVVAVGMVAVDTPPFVWIIDWLRNHIPLLSQFFRFPFTKWGTALALSYAIWLGIGISWMADRLKTRGSKVLPIIVVLVTITLSIIGSIGMLQGQLISTKFKLTIPNEYFQLFTTLKSLPPGRIANLPQNTYWGWTYNRWGYSGSGFLWYGIENPIMDRAFDVWTREGEQYYWELSRALYSKNAAAFDSVLRKYDVRYVLLDESVVSPSSDRGLFLPETKELISQMSAIREVARFGNLTLYERTGSAQSFVSLKSNLPTVSPAYRWTDNDVAYRDLGDYITKPTTPDVRTSFTSGVYSYPFRSLFTKRSVDEREFDVEEVLTRVDALVYDSAKSADLVAENVKPCGVAREGTAGAITTDQGLRFTSHNQRGCLSFGVGNLPHREGYLVAVESRHISGRPLLFSIINDTAKHVELEVYLENLKLKTQSSKQNDEQWQTDYFVLPPLANDGLGYTVYLSNDAIGRQETINDIKSIKFYRMPYQELVTLRTAGVQPPSSKNQPQGTFAKLSVNPLLSVNHPNPAYYKIAFRSNEVTNNELTLVLSQSFDNGWIALTKTPTFPFVKPIGDHVLVNNWSNGWNLPSNEVTNNERTIVIFFLPQLLEWFGFLLLPIPFLV